MYLSPAHGPCRASSKAAVSRRVRVRAKCSLSPNSASPMSGPHGMRPRVGLRPITPQQAAGTRSEPAPSEPWAIGTAPAATSAAEPPLEPPALRSGSNGLRVGPVRSGSVVSAIPSSGVVVRPSVFRPAARTRRMRSLSWSGRMPGTAREPP